MLNANLKNLFLLVVFLSSCQKFEQNNPFDSKCPKELWTPTSFTAVQNGTTVTLSWNQPMNNISGFKLTKKVDTGSATDMQSQNKGIAQFTDPTLIGGKLHTYTIVAYAGNNLSNLLTTTVTPKLAAGGVTTTAPGTITALTASSGGTITTDGGSPITVRGICWGTSASPTITGSKTMDGTGIGTFSSTLAGLSANTTYFVRAYATNTVATTYGNEVSFKTSNGISTISTANITAISATAATGGGTISADGGAAITARGVCWGTAATPTITGSKTMDGTGIGTFTSSFTGLAFNSTYYVRAYASNSLGTTYGNEVSFKTLAVGATVSTTNAMATTNTTATSGGNITSDGGSSITARGVCWNTTTAPTIANNKTADGAGAGTFTSTINGLTAGITYYVRSYATNSIVTVYGNEVILKIQVSAVIFNSSLTYGSISDVEGNTYKTIEIGTQKWIAENLRTSKYKDGTAIPLVTDNTLWDNLTTPAYCWHNNDAVTYKSTYGAIYNWYTVNTGKLCPTGWHAPSYGEWATLRDYLGGLPVAGGKIKESGTAHWVTPNTGAANSSGLSILPGGLKNTNEFGYYGWYWTSESGACIRIPYDCPEFWIYGIGNGGGASVRCLADGMTVPTIATSPVASVTTTSAITGGNVTSDGGLTISARGVCWSTTTNPTIANNKTIDGKGVGSFTSTLTGLSTNTTYYVRAYATNAIGTAYGTVSSITLYLNTPSSPISDIDGNVYKTVRIGDQIWMAENLKVTKYRNGIAIPNVTVSTTWASLTSGAWCDFGNNTTVGATYGHLYNYFTVIDSRQLCPVGYHIPSSAEWTTITDYLGGGKIAGAALKETGTSHWSSPNTSTNSSGFTALAGSWRGGDAIFYYAPTLCGYYWSSTSYDLIYSNFFHFEVDNNSGVVLADPYFSKQAGCSIRCLKD
ncbi:MAG: fibrobacter succinogenes major paralogous domain-containing protein [Prolixibacteraceae bacterium]